jgi:hypothetical protein
VSDGTRTRGHRDHNPVLYQLSYTHRGDRADTPDVGADRLPRDRQRKRSPTGHSDAPQPVQTPVRLLPTSAATARDAVVSGPGCGTNTVAR